MADITRDTFLPPMARQSDGTPRPDNRDFSEFLVSFGANSRAARVKPGFTQARLAEQSGLLRQYVSLVESGMQNMTLTTALTLAIVVRRHLGGLLRRPKSPTRGKRAQDISDTRRFNCLATASAQLFRVTRGPDRSDRRAGDPFAGVFTPWDLAEHLRSRGLGHPDRFP